MPIFFYIPPLRNNRGLKLLHSVRGTVKRSGWEETEDTHAEGEDFHKGPGRRVRGGKGGASKGGTLPSPPYRSPEGNLRVYRPTNTITVFVVAFVVVIVVAYFAGITQRFTRSHFGYAVI